MARRAPSHRGAGSKRGTGVFRRSLRVRDALRNRHVNRLGHTLAEVSRCLGLLTRGDVRHQGLEPRTR